jgi:DNA-directed RNA polymerase specialized sigma24 family protein
VVPLSEVDADKWPPLLKQVALAKKGYTRPAQPSIADGYEAVSQLRQQHKRLTDHEVDQLVVAYRAGSTILELAAEFDCDRKTVICYLKLHCIETRYRRLSETQIDEAVRLYASGLSLAKLGKRFGVDPKTVRARLQERGVQLR